MLPWQRYVWIYVLLTNTLIVVHGVQGKIVFFHPDWQSTFKVQGTSRYVIHTLPQQSNVVTRMRQIFSLIVVQGVQEKKHCQKTSYSFVPTD